MEKTVISGDKILVSKLAYGPLLPSSPFEIPLVNLVVYMNKKARQRIGISWWDPKRLWGFSSLRHNDLVVYKNEVVGPGFYIKRCVALPGDILLLKSTTLTINGSPNGFDTIPTILRRWHLYAKDKPQVMHQLIDLNIGYKELEHEVRQLLIYTTLKQVEVLLLSTSIDSIIPDIHPIPDKGYVYPHLPGFNWSVEHFGPVCLPYRGMSLSMNDSTAALYSNTIVNFEPHELNVPDSLVSHELVKIGSYTFQKDYCFVMGDNFYDSHDSRYFGFLPVEKIHGSKASLVLWSSTSNHMRWDRLLKRLI